MTKDLALFLCGQLQAMKLITVNNSTVQAYVESQIEMFLKNQKREIKPISSN